jgi:hypothetical protein
MASVDQFIRGLELLRPHFKGDYCFHAEHDIFYVRTTFETEEETPAEIRVAFETGPWHWDNESCRWAAFV